VRRKLLQVLNQAGTSGAGVSLSWLDWLRRPATLAYAGSIAVVIFAVTLGTRVYQDSLKQAAQSVATEDTTSVVSSLPPSPASQPEQRQSGEPQAKTKESAPASADQSKKDALADKMVKRERAAPAKPQEQRASDKAHDGAVLRSELGESRKKSEAPVAALGKKAEEATASADQKMAANAPPPAATPTPAPMQTPARGTASGSAALALSARALFYGEQARPDSGMIAHEKERAMKPLAESAPRAGRLERKMDQFSAVAGKAAGTIQQAKPLGLRYSFVVRDADGRDREVDATTAAKRSEPARLTVEANQDSYMQIWQAGESSSLQLLFPEKESGQISSKLNAGQRQSLLLPAEGGTITLRLSRVPFGPITRQESAMLDRPSPTQLQETVTASAAAGSQEQATYVVNQDLSPTAQIAVEIPFHR
jgi:hypothetical protein